MFFFFKHKTAYEMRISDWSSDVCSSDLFVKDAAREFPGGIVVAVDARDGFVATEGWAERSDMPVADMARRFEDAGVAALLFTDVGRDGLLKGCNVEATVDLARATDIPV